MRTRTLLVAPALTLALLLPAATSYAVPAASRVSTVTHQDATGDVGTRHVSRSGGGPVTQAKRTDIYSTTMKVTASALVVGFDTRAPLPNQEYAVSVLVKGDPAGTDEDYLFADYRFNGHSTLSLYHGLDGGGGQVTCAHLEVVVDDLELTATIPQSCLGGLKSLRAGLGLVTEDASTRTEYYDDAFRGKRVTQYTTVKLGPKVSVA